MIVKSSNCFEDMTDALAKQALPARFLEAPDTKTLLDHLRAALPCGKSFTWQCFQHHHIPLEDAWRTISGWPGNRVFVVCLDLTEKRVLEIDKGWAPVFFDEYVYPTEDTYMVSEDLQHMMCFDHNYVVHTHALRVS